VIERFFKPRKYYLSRENSAPISATSQMRETLPATKTKPETVISKIVSFGVITATNFKMIKSTLEDLFNFIKIPDDRQISISNYGKLKLILILVAVNLAINIVVILPLLSTIKEFVPLDSNQSTYGPLAKIVIVTIILMPFLEELFFRYFLRYVGANTFLFKLKK